MRRSDPTAAADATVEAALVGHAVLIAAVAAADVAETGADPVDSEAATEAEIAVDAGTTAGHVETAVAADRAGE